jgi:hypothetical protein
MGVCKASFFFLVTSHPLTWTGSTKGWWLIQVLYFWRCSIVFTTSGNECLGLQSPRLMRFRRSFALFMLTGACFAHWGKPGRVCVGGCSRLVCTVTTTKILPNSCFQRELHLYFKTLLPAFIFFGIVLYIHLTYGSFLPHILVDFWLIFVHSSWLI